MIPLHSQDLRQIDEYDNVTKLQNALWSSKYCNENNGWRIDEHTAVVLTTDCYGGDKCRNRWLEVQYHDIHGQVARYTIAAVGNSAVQRRYTNRFIEIQAKKVLEFLVSKDILAN